MAETAPTRSMGRAMFFVPAGISLLAGLTAALMLVADRESAERLPSVHGVVMVLGFLGTLVALERAVALRRMWAYAAPACLGLGGIALVAPLPLLAGRLLLVVGAALAVATLSVLWRRQQDDATAGQILGAVMALVAALLWTRLDVADVLPWLVGFVVLTIAAERLELARLTMPPRAGRVLLVVSSLVLLAAVASLMWPQLGARAFGVVLAGLVLWLARHDVARRLIRSAGLPRFAAAALLGGYVWLFAAAVVWAVGGMPRTPAAYDTVVHASFLAFAMSMVIAHAPVIFPSVLRRPLPYRSVMWLPLVVLHVGLVLRLIPGNLLGQDGLWRLGSWLDVAALLLFVGTTAGSAIASASRSADS
ncbi:MAG: hypothetical protein WAR57_04955 [Candidatus Phosphoribacter sp.]